MRLQKECKDDEYSYWRSFSFLIDFKMLLGKKETSFPQLYNGDRNRPKTKWEIGNCKTISVLLGISTSKGSKYRWCHVSLSSGPALNFKMSVIWTGVMLLWISLSFRSLGGNADDVKTTESQKGWKGPLEIISSGWLGCFNYMCSNVIPHSSR